MGLYTAITEHYGFDVPDEYRALRAQGLFDHEGPRELFLSDLQWMSLSAIARHRRARGAISFAHTARRDYFCWSGAADRERVAVEFHARGEPAILYAPNFTAFLFRALLEEFSLSWLVTSFGVENTAARFRRYADEVSRFLPEEWAQTLRELSRRPLVRLDSGVYGVLSREASDRLIKDALATPGLNRPLTESALVETEASIVA